MSPIVHLPERVCCLLVLACSIPHPYLRRVRSLRGVLELFIERMLVAHLADLGVVTVHNSQLLAIATIWRAAAYASVVSRSARRRLVEHLGRMNVTPDDTRLED